jgi:hypothetical protein
VSKPANARMPKSLRSLSDSFAAAPADRFMHAPQLKKWTAIIDHHSGIRLLACNRDLNLAPLYLNKSSTQ